MSNPDTTFPHTRSVADDGGWQATELVAPATQVANDQEDYLANSNREVGRDLGNGQHELFVACAPGEALQQQFNHLQPDFIAVHDIGTASSRRLIAGLARASDRPVQKLVIRRQGQGQALATLEFVALECTDGRLLRLYTTETEAEADTRQELARWLLAYSRLAVVIVGDVPGAALTAALGPMGDAIGIGPWPNQQLLMLPLASAVTLATLASHLGHRGPVSVRTTPQVTRPADAWNYISGAWNRLREQLATTGIELPEIGPVMRPSALQAAMAPPAGAAGVNAPGAAAALAAGADSPLANKLAAVGMVVRTPPISAVIGNGYPAAPLPMQPMPAIPTAETRLATATPSTTDQRLQAYVDRLCALNGVVCASVFELNAQRSIVHAGARPGPAMLAIQGSAMISAIADSARRLGLGGNVPEAAITLGSHHVVLRAVPRHPGLMLHAVLDKEVANLTLARMQIQRLDEVFEG